LNIRRSLLASLGLPLLLAACSTPSTPTATRPTPATQPGSEVHAAGPLYEVAFQSVGADTPAVKAQTLTPSRVAAQGFVNAPDEAIAITPTPVSVASFTDRVRKVRHVEATFQVTNTTAATLSNLYFLPTVTADTDGDPSNNASTPTIAGTPYSALTYFDGSDASAKAASLQATSGETLDPATGEIIYTGNIYRSNLDVSGVVPVPPAGLSATVQNAGWRVALALAPGEHTTVTLGVDIQGIDPDSPKSDVYNFRLVFTPVQDDPALTATGSVPDATRIRGRVTDTALFGGRATFGSLYTAPGFDIGAAGEVDYALPAVPAASDFTRVIPAGGSFSSNCSFIGTISDSDAEIAVYDALRTTGAQGDRSGSCRNPSWPGASSHVQGRARLRQGAGRH